MTRAIPFRLCLALLVASPVAAQYRPGLETRDERGRVVAVTDDEVRRVDFTYDADASQHVQLGGREIAVKKRDGTEIAFAYDEHGVKIQTRITRPGSNPQYIDHRPTPAGRGSGAPAVMR